jgi:hypothetical protein
MEHSRTECSKIDEPFKLLKDSKPFFLLMGTTPFFHLHEMSLNGWQEKKKDIIIFGKEDRVINMPSFEAIVRALVSFI